MFSRTEHQSGRISTAVMIMNIGSLAEGSYLTILWEHLHMEIIIIVFKIIDGCWVAYLDREFVPGVDNSAWEKVLPEIQATLFWHQTIVNITSGFFWVAFLYEFEKISFVKSRHVVHYLEYLNEVSPFPSCLKGCHPDVCKLCLVIRISLIGYHSKSTTLNFF